MRRDIDRLRDLGYPVDATPGIAGGYRLGAGAPLPPLLLDDEEAVAVAISLHTATAGSVAGLEETSLRALTKLQQMLPSRLRRTGQRPARHDGAADRAGRATPWTPTCSPRSRPPAGTSGGCGFGYPGGDGVTPREVEPHRLVHTSAPLVPGGLGHRA